MSTEAQAQTAFEVLNLALSYALTGIGIIGFFVVILLVFDDLWSNNFYRRAKAKED